jgi:2-oxoisovalerate dehydrogenase E1 component
MSTATLKKKAFTTSNEVFAKAYRLMCTAKAMTTLYEENARVTSKYVHATSRGHEAIQLAWACNCCPAIS